MTYDDGVAYCRRHHGNLLSINSMEENKRAHRYLRKSRIPRSNTVDIFIYRCCLGRSSDTLGVGGLNVDILMNNPILMS